MQSERPTRSITDILSALTIAVLFLVILLLVVFTASSYHHGAAYQAANDNQRVVCSYVATSIKDNNGGEVTPMIFGGYPGVVIEDGDTGFAHKIYMKDGALLEEFAKADAAIDPNTANKIGETSVFNVRYITDTLLEIETDKGASYVQVMK